MKKLLVVFTAILVVAFAAPAFAVDADWTGEFDFGGITGFAKDKVNNAYGNAYFTGTLGVDSYNDVVIRLVAEDIGGGAPWWGVGKAYLKSDVGEAAGLPVPLTVTGGYVDLSSRWFEVTGHATERVLVEAGIGTSSMIKASIGAGPATVDLGIGFDMSDAAAMTQDYALLVTVPDIADMITAEVGYFISDDDDFKGAFMITVAAVGIADMIDVAAGFKYDTQAAGGLGAENMFWGLGVKANDIADMIGIGLGVNGQEEAMFQNLTIDVNVAIMDNVGVDLGVGLGFGDVLETFGGLDASVYYEVGASTWRAGYLYQGSEINNYAYTAPTQAVPGPGPDGSGLYLTASIDI